MRYFLKELLEPISYLLYGFLLFAAYAARKVEMYKLLSLYYVFASAMLFIANAENDAHRNSDWNYNFLFLVCILVFSYYYYHICQAIIKRRFIINCCLANTATFFYFMIKKNGLFTYNTYAYALAFISIIIYSLFYYQQVLQQVSEESILRKFDFWLVSANLFYYMGAFIVVLFYDYSDLTIRGELWGAQSIVLFMSCLIAFRGYIATIKKDT